MKTAELTNYSTIERDSRKDEAVVFIFIFATGGLLAWAILKPWIERYLEVKSCLFFLFFLKEAAANKNTGCARAPIVHAR
jgi:hypothetical protein